MVVREDAAKAAFFLADRAAMARTEQFAVMKSEIDGRPIIVLVNTALRDRTAQENFPFFVSIGTTIENPNEFGLPSNEEAERLNIWEDEIEANIHALTQYAFVGRVTFNAQRELLIYVSSKGALVKKLEEIVRSGACRPFGFNVQDDPNWEAVQPYFEKRLPNGEKRGFLARIFRR